MPRIRHRALASITTSNEPTKCPGNNQLVANPFSSISQRGHEGLERLLQTFGGLFDGQTGASKLRKALRQEAVQADIRDLVIGTTLALGGVVASVGALLSPTGPGGCDHSPLERCCNCVTSIPYVIVGAHAIKERRTSAGKAWGASMCAVGAASTTFHASRGKWRTLGRRLDYWSIAWSSNLLLRAATPNLPPIVTAAGMALTPFKPFLVSFLNSAAMEVQFLHRAYKNKQLRPAQRLHAATCLAGLAAFALEEFYPKAPLLHSAWHVLSATSVATVNDLLADVENQWLGKKQVQKLLPVTPLTLTPTTSDSSISASTSSSSLASPFRDLELLQTA